MSAESSARAARIEQILKSGSSILERGEALRACLLALISGESVFLYGKPGTAKNMIAGWISAAVSGARLFSCLLSQYTQPDELFGPVSIEKLQAGEREILTEGYMPQSEVAFLDEVFKAGPAILNTLLAILNERVFRNGSRIESVPTRLVIGASNELPSDESGLEAFFDRFLIRLEVRQISSKVSFAALVSGKAKQPLPPTNPLTIREVEEWQAESEKVDFPDYVYSYLFSLRLRIAESSIFVSDRRWAKAGHLLKVSAYMNGRAAVSVQDVLILENVLWSRTEERTQIVEFARKAVSNELVYGSFAFVGRIKNEIVRFTTREIKTAEEFAALEKEIAASLEYLEKLSAELSNALSGSASFWRNIFCTLESPFCRALMEECVKRLVFFADDSARILESLRFSKRPKLNAALNAAAPTVILKAADEAISAAAASKRNAVQKESAEKLPKSTNLPVLPKIDEIEKENEQIEPISQPNSTAEDKKNEPTQPENLEKAETSLVEETKKTSTPLGSSFFENEQIVPHSQELTQRNQTSLSSSEQFPKVQKIRNGDIEIPKPLPQHSKVANWEKNRNAESDSEAIAALLRPPPSKMASIGGAIKNFFVGDKKLESSKTQNSPALTNRLEKKRERTKEYFSSNMEPVSRKGVFQKPELSLRNEKIAEKTRPSEKPVINNNWQKTLSQVQTFEEFIKISGFPYQGNAGDMRYRWNDNENNGEKWWNVGSRFNRFLEDRAAIAAIETECSKRGAGIGGKYHWVYAVCYIFEKNDGVFGERTKAELAWLSGDAWGILEAALKEALA